MHRDRCVNCGESVTEHILKRFRIYTTRGHVATIGATDVEHAHRLFTGKEWPPGIRPAPKPADRIIPDSGGRIEPTPEWSDWYRNEFLPQRAKYPTLDWSRGECMLTIVEDDDSSCSGTYNTTAERPYGYCCAIGGCGAALSPESGDTDRAGRVWKHE